MIFKFIKKINKFISYKCFNSFIISSTTSLQSGADLNYIKEILGHSSIGTTEIYLHIQNQYLENQHKKFSKLSELAYRL